MSDTIAAVAALMRMDADALRMIAQNIANAQSVAYRRTVPVAHAAFEDTAALLAQSRLGHTAVAEGVPLLDAAVDLRPGTLETTGGALDLAIEGNGFFVVATAAGEAFVRRGDFRLDALGYLVTQAGDPVLGASGPLQIGAARPVVAADGTVRAEDQIIGRLRIVEAGPDAELQPSATGELTLAAGEMIETGASSVRQGFLETSNVQSVSEMLRLMETMRRFETAQRFAQGYDSMVQQAISTLGRV